jgi:hypothetical protein
MAEIIPFEPETGNAGAGRKSHHFINIPDFFNAETQKRRVFLEAAKSLY